MIIEIKYLRDEIDKIDQQILELILKRREIVRKVGETKKITTTPVYVPDRERAIFNKISERNKIPMESIVPIFTEIISFCRVAEKKIKVAITKNSFLSLLALRELLGQQVDFSYFSNLNDISLESLEYILTQLNDETINFLLKNKWKIIHKVVIFEKSFFLLSKFDCSYSGSISFVVLDEFNCVREISELKSVDNYRVLGSFPKK